ncbi:MAG: TIGR02147 family protein [Bacteriovoracia bacterium]
MNKSKRSPDLYTFLDYRKYLRDWVVSEKKHRGSYSLHQLSREAGLSVAHLPLILDHERTMTAEVQARLAPVLGLEGESLEYFGTLRALNDSPDFEVRLRALRQAQKARKFRKNNPREVEAYRYLTRWYNVAIREMAALPGFRLEWSWIQKHLRKLVPRREIEAALRFLQRNGFIAFSEAENRAWLPEKKVDCDGGVYRLTMGKFHEQMLALAADSIHTVERDERRIQSYTLAIHHESFVKIQAIIDRAYQEIAMVSKQQESEKLDTVYHVFFGAFPLTKKQGGTL